MAPQEYEAICTTASGDGCPARKAKGSPTLICNRNPLKPLALVLLCGSLGGCLGGSGNERYLPAYTPPDPPPVPGVKPAAPAARPPQVPGAWSSRSPTAAQIAARPAPVEVQVLSVPARVSEQKVVKKTRPNTLKAETGETLYRVQAGDTASAIARRFDLPLATMAAYNGLAPPYHLRVGQTLKVPPQRRHRVAEGDTVYGLAVRYDSDLIRLVQLNNLAPPYTVTPGQVLLIPDKADVRGGHIVTAAPEDAVPSTPDELRAAGPAEAVPDRKPAKRSKIPAPPPLTGDTFSWPVEGRVILGFGPRGGGQQNDGINIAAPRGTPVRAAESGVVAYSGNELRGFGNLVLIKHQDGWTTAYAHVEEVRVVRGDMVKRGDVIGRVGTTGNVDRPQLHFEVRQGARAVDPIKKLGRRTATSGGDKASKG